MPRTERDLVESAVVHPRVVRDADLRSAYRAAVWKRLPEADLTEAVRHEAARVRRVTAGALLVVVAVAVLATAATRSPWGLAAIGLIAPVFLVLGPALRSTAEIPIRQMLEHRNARQAEAATTAARRAFAAKERAEADGQAALQTIEASLSDAWPRLDDLPLAAAESALSTLEAAVSSHQAAAEHAHQALATYNDELEGLDHTFPTIRGGLDDVLPLSLARAGAVGVRVKELEAAEVRQRMMDSLEQTAAAGATMPGAKFVASCEAVAAVLTEYREAHKAAQAAARENAEALATVQRRFPSIPVLADDGAVAARDCCALFIRAWGAQARDVVADVDSYLQEARGYVGARRYRAARSAFTAYRDKRQDYREWADSARTRLADRLRGVVLGEPTDEEARQIDALVPGDVPGYEATIASFTAEIETNPEACEAFFRMDFEDSMRGSVERLQTELTQAVARVDEDLQGLQREIDGKADRNHEHPEYARVDHRHP